MTRDVRTRRSALAGAVLIAVVGLPLRQGGQAQAPATVTDRQIVEQGKELFAEYGCYACHGRDAQGGANGPRLIPRAIPLELFIEYVRRPAGSMPPYTRRVIADQDLAAIEQFLRDLPAPVPVETIPLLNQ